MINVVQPEIKKVVKNPEIKTDADGKMFIVSKDGKKLEV